MCKKNNSLPIMVSYQVNLLRTALEHITPYQHQCNVQSLVDKIDWTSLSDTDKHDDCSLDIFL